MRYEIQSADCWDDFVEAVSLAWGGIDHSAEVHERYAEVFEPKRSLLVRAGHDVCATMAVYSLEMSVAGGFQPVVGLGWIAVSPAHRRQGLMRALIRQTLEDLHNSNQEPVAALNTTEAAIYGRFSFGVASRVARLTIPRDSRALEGYLCDAALRVRIDEPQACQGEIAEI